MLNEKWPLTKRIISPMSVLSVIRAWTESLALRDTRNNVSTDCKVRGRCWRLKVDGVLLPGAKNFVPYQCPSPKMAQKSAGAFIDNFLPRLSGLYNRWCGERWWCGGQRCSSTCYCAGTEHPTVRWRTWTTTTTTPPVKHAREPGSGAAWWKASGTSSSSTPTLRESTKTHDNNNLHQPPRPPS